jgi:Tol biopolymer transport system component
MQVYVENFPGKEGKFQVSTENGTRPVWSRDGKELFYLANGGQMMTVDVKTGASFEHGLPKMLFNMRVGNNTRFDVSSDGQRFLMVSGSGGMGTNSMMVVLNWQAGLKK